MFFVAIRILSRVYPGRVSWDLSRPLRQAQGRLCGTKILTTAHADSLETHPGQRSRAIVPVVAGPTEQKRPRSAPDSQTIGEVAQEEGGLIALIALIALLALIFLATVPIACPELVEGTAFIRGLFSLISLFAQSFPA